MHKFRSTKIVATLGPASNNTEVIGKLCNAGVNVFRLNFSHGSHEDHRQAFLNIRAAEKQHGQPIAIMLDLQGPKLRIGKFEHDLIKLKPNQKFQLDLNEALGNNERVFFGHPEIFKSLVKGSDILIDDGKVLLRVDEQYSDRVICTVISGNELSNRKGVNLPSVLLPIGAMTEKDDIDLKFGLELGVDWVAISFVQNASDIIIAKKKIPFGTKILAKIEKPLAIENLSSIIDASDGIMVARGDLGVEVPMEQVPALQKKIIRECRMKGKPVIVATHMLDSMVSSPTPTRAEVSDVANAVYDHADAVMLSAESASGKYPVESVEMMNKIIMHVEQDKVFLESSHKLPFVQEVCTSITYAIPEIIENSNIRFIVAISEIGAIATKISRERPKAPIITFTHNEKTARYLCMVWGVRPFYIDAFVDEAIEVEDFIRRTLSDSGIAKNGENLLVISSNKDSSEKEASIVNIVSV